MNSQSQTLTQAESLWIAEVAGRLRLIQADTAESAAEKRREFLQEEIARNLKAVPAVNRKRYLEALLTRFPIGGEIGRSAAAPAAPTPAPEPKPMTAEETIERFFDIVSKAPSDKRAEPRYLCGRFPDTGPALWDRLEDHGADSPAIRWDDFAVHFGDAHGTPRRMRTT